MKHHGPLLNGTHRPGTWGRWFSQAAKHWQTPGCWINIPFVNYLQMVRNDGKGKHKAETSKHFMILNACWSPHQALGHQCVGEAGVHTSRKLGLPAGFSCFPTYSSEVFFWWFCQLVFAFPMSWHSVLNMLMGHCRHCCHDLCSTNETICWVSLSLYMPFQALIPWDHTGKAVTAFTAVPSCDFRRWLSYRKGPFSGWDAKLLSWTLVTFEDHRLLFLTKKPLN